MCGVDVDWSVSLAAQPVMIIMQTGHLYWDSTRPAP